MRCLNFFKQSPLNIFFFLVLLGADYEFHVTEQVATWGSGTCSSRNIFEICFIGKQDSGSIYVLMECDRSGTTCRL